MTAALGPTGPLALLAASIPDRKWPLQFVRRYCSIGLHEAQTALERIATAAGETLHEQQHRVEPAFMQCLRVEWDAGLFSLK